MSAATYHKDSPKELADWIRENVIDWDGSYKTARYLQAACELLETHEKNALATKKYQKQNKWIVGMMKGMSHTIQVTISDSEFENIAD